MKNRKPFLNTILQEISLDKNEEEKIKKITSEVIKTAKRERLTLRIGGSLAKSTIIKKDKQDVDLFLQYRKKENLENFEKDIKKIAKDGKFVHGSREYYTFTKEGIKFEVIPILKFKSPEEAENVTDFSLIHVDYINRIIKKNPSLSQEIKLAKYFCYAQEVYGAESYIGGFSGYALEVLVCYYGSFINFLKRIRKDTIIDPKRYFKNKKEIINELNQSKLKSPIVLIDPTYKYRNVCAGLSKETYELFIKKASEFLKKPSKIFFEKKKFDLSELIENSKKEKLILVEIDISTKKQEGDIAGTKMKKLFKFLKEELERKKQKVIDSKFIYEGGQIAKGYFLIRIEKEIEIIGPRNIKEMREAIEKFKKVRKKTYLSRGFFCATEKFDLQSFFLKEKEKTTDMKTNFSWKVKSPK